MKVFWENIVNRFVLPQPLFPTMTTFFLITSIQLGYKEGIGNSVASVGAKISYPSSPKIRIDLNHRISLKGSKFNDINNFGIIIKYPLFHVALLLKNSKFSP